MFTSCGNSLEDKAFELYADATDKVENATSLDELKEIKENLVSDALKLTFSSDKEDVKALEEDEAFNKKMDEVEDAFEEAYKAKKKELKEKK